MTRPFAPLVLEDAALRVELLPAKGGEIVSIVHRPTGTELLARLRPLPDDDGTLAPTADGFDRWYAGGWQSLLPNGDTACTVDGIAHAFHGDTWGVPFAVDAHDGTGATLVGRAVRLPLRVERRLALDEERAMLVVDETVANEGDAPARLLWGHHPAFGPPLLGPGARIELAGGRMRTVHVDSRSRLAPAEGLAWPHAVGVDGAAVDVSAVPGPDARAHDLCLLDGLAEGRVRLVQPALGLAARLEWDAARFPWLWVWQLFGAADDPPFSEGYCLALEPWTGPPCLAEGVRRGDALALAPGELRSTRITLAVERLVPTA